MQCLRCGCEKFRIVKVHRNCAISDKSGKKVKSAYNDLRLILCVDCGMQYSADTRLLFGYIYNPKTCKLERVELEAIKRKAEQDELF